MSIEFDQQYIDFSLARDYPPAPPEEQPKPSGAGAGRGSYAGFDPRMDMANKGPQDTIKAIEPTRFEQALQATGLTLEQAGRFLDSLGQVDVPLLGKVSLADFVPFVGSAKEGSRSVLSDGPEWEGTPMALQQAGTGQSLTRGTGFARQLTPDAGLALMDVATNIVPVGKAAAAAAKATKNLPVGMSTKAIGGMEGVLTPPPNVVSTSPLNIVQPGPKLTKVVTEDQVNTTNFKTWFGDWQTAPETASKVVDKTGAPLAVFHGTARPDRVGVNFRKSRATSGPMSFFTDDPEIASGYAKGKQDTSLAYEETDYANWFKKKDGRSMVNLDQAGARMSAQEKQDVIAKLRDINMTDDGEIVYQPGGGTIMTDSSFDFYLQREAKGNPLKLAKQLWLESGTLYNDEEKFAKVLQLAGVKGFDADFPNASYPAVYKVFLDIKNPLDTATITSEFVADLEAAASRIRKKAARGGADAWDKNTIPPKEWVQRLKYDLQNGTTHAWTSIPDWVTDRLKASGFDGIKDTGGKRGGVSHTVWIPFEETQVKSAMGNIGTFDPSKKNILRGAGAGGTAAGTATMQDKEQQ